MTRFTSLISIDAARILIVCICSLAMILADRAASFPV
jgi:hypothetical protein